MAAERDREVREARGLCQAARHDGAGGDRARRDERGAGGDREARPGGGGAVA